MKIEMIRNEETHEELLEKEFTEFAEFWGVENTTGLEITYANGFEIFWVEED